MYISDFFYSIEMSEPSSVAGGNASLAVSSTDQASATAAGVGKVVNDSVADTKSI
jgi:hypothetical protein